MRIYTRAAPIDRFLAKVNKTETCWLWTAACFDNGYGAFRYDQQQTRAHRWSYQHFIGPIPDGLILMHTCDVRNCVNPAHLVPGTQSENQQDMVKKGRIGGVRLTNGRKGSRSRAKLTLEIAEEIRGKYARGGHTHRSLGAEYGVSYAAIRAILIGRSWRD